LSNIIGIRTGLARKPNSVGFEVLAPVVMKNSVFWGITPRSPLKVNVSEEHVAYIIRVEEKPSKKPA
jgi:hypothetical protein